MWSKLSRLTTRAPGPRPGPARHRFVPRLRPLEERAVPATLTVTTRADVVDPADHQLSLREAITQANATADADTIRLGTGVYKITRAGGGEDGNLTGDFDVTNPVTIVGAGAGATAIDGGRLDRVFQVRGTGPSSFAVTLQGLTVRNGISIIQAGATTPTGGGIQVGNADLTLRGVVVTANQAADKGGGISNAGQTGTGNLTLVNSTVSRNVAGNDGGGIFLGGATVTVTGGAIRRNYAGHSGGGAYVGFTNFTGGDVSLNLAADEAGGLYVFDTARLTGTTLRANAASPAAFGGGLVTTSAFLTNCTVAGNAGGNGAGVAATVATLTGCRVEGNSAALAGGGVYAIQAAEVTNSTVRGNTAAADGGGVFSPGTALLTGTTVEGNFSRGAGGGVAAKTAIVIASTVNDNYAAGNGGGVSATFVDLRNATVGGNTGGAGGGGVFASHGVLQNCTIVENVSNSGGGGVTGASASDPLRVQNSLIALNLAPQSGHSDVDGSFVSDGNNLVGVADGGAGFGAAGDLLGSLIDPLDPKLGPLANNGGRTRTYALLAGSPAIDHGNNTGAPATDQRGVHRPRDGDGNGTAVVDIGAVER